MTEPKTETDPTTDELKELTEDALDGAEPASPYYSADSIVRVKDGEVRVVDRDYITKNPKNSGGVKRCEQNALDDAGLEWEFKTDRRFRDDKNKSVVIITGVEREDDAATDGGVVAMTDGGEDQDGDAMDLNELRNRLDTVEDGDYLEVTYRSTRSGNPIDTAGEVADREVRGSCVWWADITTEDSRTVRVEDDGECSSVREDGATITLGEVLDFRREKDMESEQDAPEVAADGGHVDIRIIGRRPHGSVRVEYHPEDTDTAEDLFTWASAAVGCFRDALDNRKVRDGQDLGFIRVNPESGNATEVHVREDLLRDRVGINYAAEVLEMANGEQPYTTFGEDPFSWEDPEFHLITEDADTAGADSTRADGGERVMTDGGTDYSNISEGDVIHVEYTSPRTKDGQTLEREGKVQDVTRWETGDGIDTVEFITAEHQCRVLFGEDGPATLKQKSSRWTELGDVESLAVRTTITDGGRAHVEREDQVAVLWAFRDDTEDALFIRAVGADLPVNVIEHAEWRLRRKDAYSRLLAALAPGEYHRVGYVTENGDGPRDYETWMDRDILPFQVPYAGDTEDTAPDGGRLMTDGGRDTTRGQRWSSAHPRRRQREEHAARQVDAMERKQRMEQVMALADAHPGAIAASGSTRKVDLSDEPGHIQGVIMDYGRDTAGARFRVSAFYAPYGLMANVSERVDGDHTPAGEFTTEDVDPTDGWNPVTSHVELIREGRTLDEQRENAEAYIRERWVPDYGQREVITPEDVESDGGDGDV